MPPQLAVLLLCAFLLTPGIASGMPLTKCAPGSDDGWPVTLIDGLGRSVRLDHNPARIISIFSSNTELVAHLGLGNRIVGVEQYTRFPPDMANVPKIGGRLGFSVDAVVALRPDILVVTPARQAVHQLLEPMRRLDIPVIVLLSRSVSEVIGNLRLLGRALGVCERGEQKARELQARLTAVQLAVDGRKRPRAVMITGTVGNGTYLVARPDTYTGQAVVLAGAEHALGEAYPLPQVSAEAILVSLPDVLLFAGTDQGLDDLIARPGWRDLPAVQQGRVHAVARSEFLIPGPRTIDGIEKLAAWLHPKTNGSPALVLSQPTEPK